MPPLPTAVAVALAYSLGCVNAGYYLVRARTGMDLRERGSGSTGARNAGRVLGRAGFAAVFLLDAAKGAAALGAAHGLGTGRTGMVLAMLAVVLGHLFPAQLGLRGGKGASTALGALLVLAPGAAAGALALCALVAAGVRHTLTGALLAYAALPALAWALGHSRVEVAGIAGLAALLLYGHRDHLPEAATRLRRLTPFPRTSP